MDPQQAGMALASKGGLGRWAPEGGPARASEDSFIHPVKKLCLRDSPLQIPDPIPDPSSPSSALSLPDLKGPHPAATGSGAAAAGALGLGLGLSGAEEGGSSRGSLDCLGEDLLLHVMRLAQPTAWDLCRLATVSRGFREACYNRIFWTKLRVGSGSMRPGVEQLASRCTHLVELHIDDPRCELYVLHPIVVACGPSLRRVAINCDMDTSNRNEASICSILWIISLHCKNVDTVELLSDGRQAGFGYLESKALWYLTTGFRSIRSFASLCQESITKQSLYLMVIAWRELTCLRIHCGMLGTDDLVSLRKCHALRVLELVGGKLGTLVGDSNTGAGAGAGAAAGAVQGQGQVRRVGAREVVIHARLEIVVLTDILSEPQDVVCLAQQCPGLRRVLLSKGSWAHGPSVQHMARQRSQFKLLQTWLHVAKGIELLIED